MQKRIEAQLTYHTYHTLGSAIASVGSAFKPSQMYLLQDLQLDQHHQNLHTQMGDDSQQTKWGKIMMAYL